MIVPQKYEYFYPLTSSGLFAFNIAICWATFSVTIEAGNAVYVNYSSKFVVGKCISSLVEYMIAGAVAAAFL